MMAYVTVIGEDGQSVQSRSGQSQITNLDDVVDVVHYFISDMVAGIIDMSSLPVTYKYPVNFELGDIHFWVKVEVKDGI